MGHHYRALARAIAEKQLRLLRRYWLNAVAGWVAAYAMFVLVFVGGQTAAPDVLGAQLPVIIVGFFVWSMAFAAFLDPTVFIMQEAQWGTLEQLHMTPYGFGAIVAIRTAVTLLVSVVFGLGLLALMMVTTGEYLVVDVLTVAPLAILTVTSVVGVGLALGGLAIIYKRIENIFPLVQFGFFGVMLLPSDRLFVDLLPLRLGFDLLTSAMEDGRRVWELPVTDLGVLVLVAAGYVLLGRLVLRYSFRIARDRGLLSDY